jgi:hypothetical protein
MAGKKPKHHNEKKPRNWTARQMIVERIGMAGNQPMRDRRERKLLEQKRSWENEWQDDE